MADKEISSLPAATSITDADLFVLRQSGAAKKLTGAILRQYAHNIESASINAQGHLILTLKGGETVDAGTLPAGPGTGDMLASIYDAAQGRKQVAFKTDLDTVKSDLAKAQQSLKNVVNPSLLINGDFRAGCLVNQRGETSYTGNGYGIDMWKLETVSPNVITLYDGYIELSQNALIVQGLEDTYGLCDRVITASVLTTDGLYTFTATVPSKAALSSATANLSIGSASIIKGGANKGYIDMQHTASHRTLVRLRAFTGYTVNCIAAKLELGDTQTLAHQDASGNWVLNELPSYADTLALCQRYFVRIGDDRPSQNCAIGFANCANTTTANAFISTPVSLRTTPTITLKNIKLRKGITDYDVTAVNIFYATKNGIYCALTSSGLPTGETLLVRTVSAGYMDVSAEL